MWEEKEGLRRGREDLVLEELHLLYQSPPCVAWVDYIVNEPIAGGSNLQGG